MKFDPVTSEKSAAEKAIEPLAAIGWIAVLILLAVAPAIVWAVWRSLL